MRFGSGLGFQGFGDYFLNFRIGDGPGRSRARGIGQGFHSTVEKPIAPFADGLIRGVLALGHILAFQPIGATQDDPGPEGILLPRRWPVSHQLQLLPFIVSEFYLFNGSSNCHGKVYSKLPTVLKGFSLAGH